MSEEKRIAPRHKVFKHGILAFGSGGSVDCTVRSLSETGARLDVASPIGLPENFVLMIETEHWVIEGAAAVAVAAFLKEFQNYRSKTVIIVLCGRNISPEVQSVLAT